MTERSAKRAKKEVAKLLKDPSTFGKWYRESGKDVVLQIFSLLPFTVLGKLETMSKAIRNFIRDNYIWWRIYKRDFKWQYAFIADERGEMPQQYKDWLDERSEKPGVRETYWKRMYEWQTKPKAVSDKVTFRKYFFIELPVGFRPKTVDWTTAAHAPEGAVFQLIYGEYKNRPRETVLLVYPLIFSLDKSLENKTTGAVISTKRMRSLSRKEEIERLSRGVPESWVEESSALGSMQLNFELHPFFLQSQLPHQKSNR